MKHQHPEYNIQVMICQYLNIAYPNVMFMSDTIANIKLAIPQQVRNKAIQKQGFKCPDLIIFKPNSIYHGLFIELKATNIYKKDGMLLKNEHVEGQAKTIEGLNQLGYCAKFAIGFDEAKEVIDWYMRIK